MKPPANPCYAILESDEKPYIKKKKKKIHELEEFIENEEREKLPLYKDHNYISICNIYDAI